MERGAGGSRRACVNLRDLRWPALAVVLAAALVFTACAQGRDGGTTGTPPIESLRLLYAYDQSKPLDLIEAGSSLENGVEVRDVSYASAKSGRVTAYLVLPVGKEDT